MDVRQNYSRVGIVTFENSYIFSYIFNGGMESMAACLRESTARVYFSVWARPLWPRMLATVLMLAPLLNRFVPQLWRPQCQVICFWIPARATQWRRAFSTWYATAMGR